MNTNVRKSRRGLTRLTNARLKYKETGPSKALLEAEKVKAQRVKAAKNFSIGDPVDTPGGLGRVTSINLRIGTLRVRIRNRLLQDFPALEVRKLEQ